MRTDLLRAAGFGVALPLLVGLTACRGGATPVADAPSAAAPTGVAAIGRCLQDRGWTVQVDEFERSIAFSGSKQQSQAYDADYKECDEKYGEKKVAFKDFTDDMWHDLYTQETATAECLRKHDVEVPSIPTYETFVERYQGPDPWTSYGFIGSVSQDKEGELNRECPQPDL